MAQMTARAVGGYARVRSQFKMAVGRFEGVEEALTRIGAYTYMMDGTRRMPMAALDLGEKPSVISAICKFHMTERMRSIINDAMDVHGGKGICMGPGNYLGRAYQTVPIAITVEGANILTRSLIIFGQGAIRCHPWVLKEMMAVRGNDLNAFDEAFWAHVAFTISNGARSLWLGLTGGKGIPVPGSPHTRRYLQILTRFSSAFAMLADMSMFVLGGSLKRKEMLSARLGDILSHLYMMSATVKRFHDDGCPEEDLPLLTWAMYDSSFKLQVAMDGVLANFPSRPVAWLMRRLIFPKGLTLTAPHDRWAVKVAKLMIEPCAARDRLTAGMYLPRKEDDLIGRLEFAMEAVIKADPIEAKLRAAQKAGKLPQRTAAERRDAAVQSGIITLAEFEHLARTDRIRREVIMVDDFPTDLSRTSSQEPPQWPRAASM
jgi:acyl-CoA dehydrogenase